ncbi:MAG: TRAP transporter substrate-binding protein DctP [Pseudomonadota bacterium]
MRGPISRSSPKNGPTRRPRPGSPTRPFAIIGFFLAALFLFSAPASRSEAAPQLRISTENAAEHVQTRAVGKFTRLLRERLGVGFDVSHHFGAALFRDRDVVPALDAGQVEMAVPGTWQLDRFEPNMGLFLLPAFYGRGPDAYHALLDGPVGRALVARLESRLDVKVIGRWLDLGHANLYGVTRKISRHEDIAGLRIRSPGGLANEARIKALGGESVDIPWPDLPQALARGAVDGLLTTDATLAGARLWEVGVRFAFEDHEYFPMYVPMMRGGFWRRLSEAQRTAVLESWEAVVDEARREAAADQKEAAVQLTAHGIEVVRPDQGETDRWREKILPAQDAIVKDMGMDADLVEQAMKELASF